MRSALSESCRLVDDYGHCAGHVDGLRIGPARGRCVAFNPARGIGPPMLSDRRPPGVESAIRAVGRPHRGGTSAGHALGYGLRNLGVRDGGPALEYRRWGPTANGASA